MSEELINEWLKNNKPTQLNSSEKSGLANNNEYQVFKGKYKGSYRDKDGEWHVFSNVTSNTSKRKFSKNQSFKTKKTFKKNKIYQFEGYFSKAKEKERRRLIKGVRNIVPFSDKQRFKKLAKENETRIKYTQTYTI